MPHFRLRALVTLLALLLAYPVEAALTTPTCLALKRKAWINRRKCEGTEDLKRLRGKPTERAKCETTWQEALVKIDAKAVKAGITCRYGDNQDGTVIDYDTGLQWEKKTGGGSFCLLDDIHCVNDLYDWNEANRLVDASPDGATLTSCFFGFCDWRLPTVVELRSIRLASPCPANLCIDPIFGPTAANTHFTSTTGVNGSPTAAYIVNFGGSGVTNGIKDGKFYVRMVRNAF